MSLLIMPAIILYINFLSKRERGKERKFRYCEGSSLNITFVEQRGSKLYTGTKMYWASLTRSRNMIIK